MDIDALIENVKFDDVIDGVTNTTQATSALQDVIKTPDYAHFKAAAVVVLLMLCKDFGHFVIPVVVKFLIQARQAPVLHPAKLE